MFAYFNILCSNPLDIDLCNPISVKSCCDVDYFDYQGDDDNADFQFNYRFVRGLSTQLSDSDFIEILLSSSHAMLIAWTKTVFLFSLSPPLMEFLRGFQTFHDDNSLPFLELEFF